MSSIPDLERMKGLESLGKRCWPGGGGAGPGVVIQATIGGVEFPDFTPDIRVSPRGPRTLRPGHRQFAPQLFLITDPAVPR